MVFLQEKQKDKKVDFVVNGGGAIVNTKYSILR